MADRQDAVGVSHVAIVGGGPRGLAAVEALAREAKGPVKVTIFERRGSIGSGPNYAPDQTVLNILNIPLRDIDLPDAQDGSTFAAWIAGQQGRVDKDHYPPRAVMGRYLEQRFATFETRREAEFDLTVREAEIVSCRRSRAGWMLAGRRGDEWGPFGEVLLCPGHLPVNDSQTERFRAHAVRTGAVFAHVYPDASLINAAEWRDRVVAIRGFGLAMIDGVRLLTEGLGGTFEASPAGRLSYRASGREPAKLLPFSLDGMPPAPKPATRSVDSAFAVSQDAGDRFRQALADVLRQQDPDLEPLFAVLARIAGSKLGRGGESRILWWLRDGGDDDPDVPDHERPAEAMARYLAMARGEQPPSIGYATGQVWRHLQNDLRIAYNPATKSPNVASALVAFDDGMKRFSYGPPAEATSRLLALIEAGRLSLRQVDDPGLEHIEQGWRIVEGDDDDVASAMIDSVIPGAVLAEATSPLIASLRDEGTLAEQGEKLGACVSPSGQVVDVAGRVVHGLSMLGRLANGSVIATDSLHDCFGASVRRWASRVARGSAIDQKRCS